jgi:PAS domain S-box-containing protein
MKLSRPNWILTSAGIAAALTVGIYLVNDHTPRSNRRVAYRIGFQDVPPFQYKKEDGSPGGLAIDLVREAARQRGIQLEWVWYEGRSEQALRKRDVDLWPLITITPERQREKAIYISKPYLQHHFSLLVRANSKYKQPQELTGATITHLGVVSSWRETVIPRAHMVGVASHKEAIERLCNGDVDAAFMDELSARAILLSGISCNQPLREISMPAMRSRLGVGSTLESIPIADEIRRGIDTSALEGGLQKILANGGYFSSSNMEYFSALLNAQRRERWLRLAAAVFSCLFLITIVAADRIRRQRNRIKLTERALRESESKLRLLANNLSDMVLAYDMNRRLVFINPAIERMTGYTREELQNANFICWIHPDDQPRMRGYWDKLFLGSSYSNEEYRSIAKDGRLKWISATWTPIYDEAGRQVGVEGCERDITERKLAERALKESEQRLQHEAALRTSEERFRIIADTAPVMIWSAGRDKVLAFFNKTWLDFVGRTMEQELNNGWIESVHPDDLESCFSKYSHAFDARESFHIEVRLRRRDGEYRRVLCSGVPRYEPNGDFAGYIGSDVDITDLRRTQEEEFKRQKHESLNVLTGGIAHDFNNLMGSVLLDAEMAEQNLAAGEMPVEQIQRIKTVALRAAEIVRELMVYSGQEDAELGPVDLSLLVREMLALLKVSISKNAVLDTHFEQDLPAVRGNAAQLRQVVMNLVINASEAIADKNGMIQVSTSLGADPKQNLAKGGVTAIANTSVKLEVSDTGCGMTEEQTSRIFEPFYTTKFAGRGLGLAAVLGIIRGHGGTIEVESAPGRGSRFTVLLPCASQTVRSRNEAAILASKSDATHAGTILVVDDEETLRLAIATMLRKNGFAVIEAADGEESIELLRAHGTQVELILLDVTLPGLSGPELLARLRSIQPNVTVIITTAYSKECATEMMRGQPNCLFLRKPYPFKELMSLLRTAFGAPTRTSGLSADT